MPDVDGGADLSERGLRVQHEVPEGSLEDPIELVAEGCAVGDGSGFGPCAVVLSLNNSVQITFGLFVAGTVLVFLHQTVLDALQRRTQLLLIQFYHTQTHL